MLQLIAYDISSGRRLRRVERICDRYGVRVEYSVFECELHEEEFRRLWMELEKEIKPDEDALLCYPLCRVCAANVITAGTAVPTEISAVIQNCVKKRLQKQWKKVESQSVSKPKGEFGSPPHPGGCAASGCGGLLCRKPNVDSLNLRVLHSSASNPTT